MQERVLEELKALGNRVSMNEEQIVAKYNEIATQNNLDMEQPRSGMIALTLTRNFVRGALRSKSSSSKSTFGNQGFGFLVGVEQARDVQDWRRRNIMSRYNANPSEVFNAGDIAEITEVSAGVFEKSQIINGDVETKNIPEVPNSAMEVGTEDDSKWIVPLDNIKTFSSGDVNPRYGKPLPAEEYRLRAHFVGRKEDGEFQYWTLGLKNDAAKNFTCDTFRWVHLFGLFNEERNAVYGIRGKTLESLTYNDSVDPESDEHVNVDGLSMEDLLVESMGEYIADLLEIEDYHDSIRNEPGMKLVITDGIVSSMNLTPNERTGNRTMWIESAEANYGFESDDVPDSTPVWVPSYLNIDFGVGSDVIIIGRTNQTQKKDDNGNTLEGEWNPVSINLYGVLPRVALGNPEAPETNDEENSIEYW